MRTRRVLLIALAIGVSLSAVVYGHIGLMTWLETGRAQIAEIGPGPGLALAQGPPMGPPLGAPGFGPLDHLLDQLNLTTEQRASINALVDAHRQSGVASRTQMMGARRALMQAIHAEGFDEARIRAAAATVSVFEADGAVSMATLFQNIRAVLTPDQQQQLQDAWSRPPR